MSFYESMRELESYEVDEVSGGWNATYILLGTLAGIAGAGIAVAGLGTPITVAGAALSVEGASMVAIGCL